MVEITSVDNHEIWCRLNGIEKIDTPEIELIKEKIDSSFKKQVRIYVHLNTMESSDSTTISGLRSLIVYYFEKSCSVRYISQNEGLSELLEYLSLSSDG